MNNIEKGLSNLMVEYEEKSNRLYALNIKQEQAKKQMDRQRFDNLRIVLNETVHEEKPKYTTATAKKAAIKKYLSKYPIATEEEATAIIEKKTIVEVSKRYPNQEQRDLALQKYLDQDSNYNDYKREYESITLEIKQMMCDIDILKFKKSCANSLASIEAARMNLMAQEESKKAMLWSLSAGGLR